MGTREAGWKGGGELAVNRIWVRFGSGFNTQTAFSPVHQRAGDGVADYIRLLPETPRCGAQKRSGQLFLHLFVPVILSKMGADPSGLAEVIFVDHNLWSLK